jgi:putative pyruvate formate lyase activating enzyme
MIPPVKKKILLIQKRLKSAFRLLESCRVCPRCCKVNRIKGEIGYCKTGFLPEVSSDNLHFGEEPPISGTRGSGTIFLTGCSLGCLFCQNYPISHLGNGNKVSIRRLAAMMLRLQKAGAHNINFVTPTHFAPQIMGALLLACRGGLSIPLVYNCGGYESMDMLSLWEGIIDVYMPDMKYSDPQMARLACSAPDYPEHNRAAVREMHRQVGDLEIDEDGIARKGLLIRHLVLPGNISGTDEVLRFISREISPHTFVSLMSQYFPAYRATITPPLDRRINSSEYNRARTLLEDLGMERGWIQELD